MIEFKLLTVDHTSQHLYHLRSVNVQNRPMLIRVIEYHQMEARLHEKDCLVIQILIIISPKSINL